MCDNKKNHSGGGTSLHHCGLAPPLTMLCPFFILRVVYVGNFHENMDVIHKCQG